MSDVAFDARLERIVRAYGQAAVRPVDAAGIAESAMRVGGRDADRPSAALGDWTRRWLLIGLIAVLTAAAVGVLVLAGGGQHDNPLPTHGAVVPNASPNVSPPAAPRTATPAPVAEPPTNSGTWLADIPPGLRFETEPSSARISLTVDNTESGFLGLASGTRVFASTVTAFGLGELRFTSETASDPAAEAVIRDGVRVAGCQPGDEGHYRSSVTRSGLLLTLTLVSDPCVSRGAVLARTWARSLRVPNGGGAGVVDGFDPMFLVTMPAGSYVVDRDVDSTTIRQGFPDLKLSSWKDPQGFLDPCDKGRGRYRIDPGADAFVAYFRQLAGFTVDSAAEAAVDGHRAVRLVVHANPDASCPDGKLWEWQPKSVTDGAWFLRPGDTDSLFIVEHPRATVMVEVLPGPNDLEKQIVDSIRFLDRLPTQP